MMSSTTNMSPADIAAVIKDNGGFDSNGNWIWIFLIFAIFGGWGNGFGQSSGATENYVLNSDFSTLSRQIDSQTSDLRTQTTQIGNGLCDGFYTQAQLINGVNSNVANGFAQAELARANNQATLLQQMNANAISAMQNANSIQNSITSGFCQANYNNVNNTRDLIDSQNTNTQAILAKLSQMENDAKDERIASLTADNQALRFAQSQSAQNDYLVSQLRTPSPIPAYVVSNPYCNCSYSGTTVV